MFWDSSALVPVLISEASSVAVIDLLRRDAAPVMWWATPVECASALHRRRREVALTSSEVDEALERLAALSRSLDVIAAVPAVQDRARHLLAVHALRAADALQLAAALVWVDGAAHGEPLACLDVRLGHVAQAEGFVVVPDLRAPGHDPGDARTRDLRRSP